MQNCQKDGAPFCALQNKTFSLEKT